MIDALIRMYKRVEDNDITTYKPTELAGYYLANYPSDPLGMFINDFQNGLIPLTSVTYADGLIRVALREQE